jgi:hypothetical protein
MDSRLSLRDEDREGAKKAEAESSLCLLRRATSQSPRSDFPGAVESGSCGVGFSVEVGTTTSLAV